MILGKYTLNPKRILMASYTPAEVNIFLMKVSYRVGGEIIDLSQLGTEKECRKWLKQVDKIINYHVMNDINELTDEQTEKQTPIGFCPPEFGEEVE